MPSPGNGNVVAATPEQQKTTFAFELLIVQRVRQAGIKDSHGSV